MMKIKNHLFVSSGRNNPRIHIISTVSARDARLLLVNKRIFLPLQSTSLVEKSETHIVVLGFGFFLGRLLLLCN